MKDKYNLTNAQRFAIISNLKHLDFMVFNQNTSPTIHRILREAAWLGPIFIHEDKRNIDIHTGLGSIGIRIDTNNVFHVIYSDSFKEQWELFNKEYSKVVDDYVQNLLEQLPAE